MVMKSNENMKIKITIIYLLILTTNGKDAPNSSASDATSDKAPWQVSIVSSGLFGDSHFCNGALIGFKAVLTLATCCDGSSASSLKVKYGGLDRMKLASTNQVVKITMHHSYNSNTIDNNFCVITLQNKVIESANVKLIQIADKSPSTGTPAFLTGWVFTQKGAKVNNTKLQYSANKILSSAECNAKWQDINPVTNNMICTGAETPRIGMGDMGEPLVVNGKLLGISSWGFDRLKQANNRPPNYADASEPPTKAWINGLAQ